MKLILLQGPSHCGKTEIFIKLRETLLSDFKCSELHFESINKSRDFQSVIKINNKQIALFSMGDLKGECYNAIIKYLGVDVLVLPQSDGRISILNGIPMKLNYNKITGEEPPAHVMLTMTKKTTAEEMTKEEELKLSEIITELKKTI